MFLVIAAEETRVDLKKLSDSLGVKRFSFAKPEIMVAVLGVTPGSATPFALMNDGEKRVHVIVEDIYQKVSHCVFHPLKNTYSTQVTTDDLFTFIRHLGYEPRIVPLA